MFGGYKEQESFESIFLATEEEPLTRPVKKVKAEDLNTAFLPMALQEKIGKMLLELKVDLYKDGIVSIPGLVLIPGYFLLKLRRLNGSPANLAL